jgi:type IV secretion system protein VirB10
MFINKDKKKASEQPRSELQQVASTNGSPGQRILAVMVGVVGAVVILGGVAWKYVLPAFRDTKPIAAQSSPSPETSKQEAKLNVPLDLDSAAAATTADNSGMFPPAQGNSPDAHPSSPVNAANASGQYSGGGRSAPPGMNGQQIGGGGQNDSARTDAGNEREQAEQRKLRGELGEFGDTSPRIQRTSFSQAEGEDDTDDDSKAVQKEIARRRAAALQASGAQVGPKIAQQPTAAIGQPSSDAGAGNALASQLKAIPTPDGQARILQNPHLTVQKGEPLSCTLDTAIQTDTVGFIECLTDYPLKSMDGKVVLAERGTRIQGEYTRSVAPGSNSIFVLWTKATTPAPNHVEFDLLSPGTDKLGRAGIQGDVDNKFSQRYGGALMFSLLQDIGNVATTKATANGTPSVLLLPSTQSAGQSAVAELLKQGADIKPSLYRNHGDSVAITIARYIDFSSVYRLRTVKVR